MSQIITDDFSAHLPNQTTQERLIEAEPLNPHEE